MNLKTFQPRTGLYLLFPYLRGWCPTCRPIPGVRTHKSACLLSSQGSWL